MDLRNLVKKLRLIITEISLYSCIRSTVVSGITQHCVTIIHCHYNCGLLAWLYETFRTRNSEKYIKDLELSLGQKHFYVVIIDMWLSSIVRLKYR